MYIPEFWVGVGATVVAEIAVLIVALIVSAVKYKNKGGKS